MKREILSLLAVAVLWLPATLRIGASADEESARPVPTALVTAEVIEAKIAEVEAAAGDEEAKTGLIALYRKALSNLKEAASYRDAAEAFRKASQTAPAEAQAVREGMEESNIAAPEDSLAADSSTPLRELEALLQKEKADLAAVDARRADFAKRLDEEAARPALVRERLVEAQTQQEEVSAQLELPSPAEERPAKAEARRWELETRYDALSAEIEMLDQELLSQPVRVDLLTAKRDRAAASVKWVGERVKLLEDLVTRKRQAEADEARVAAEATRLEAEGRHPLVVRLAEQNAKLTEQIADSASQLDELRAQMEDAGGGARAGA